MKPRPTLAVVLAAACAASGCATGGGPDVFGRTVELVPQVKGDETPRGELLAVQDGRLWLRTKEGVRDFPASAYRDVRVRRHELGRQARTIGLVGGAVSMIALTASCASVEGNDTGGCAAVGGALGGLFALTGVLGGTSLEGSSKTHLAPVDEKLRGYARFPAGMPRDIPPEWLMQPPETKPGRERPGK